MSHMGLTPPSREVTLTPQTAAQQQPPPAIDYRPQPQTKAPYQRKADDMVTVPHNEYPTEGMTMFCRADHPPSDRSSAASPQRPSSRDSHSEYSNPTSFSSVEPTSIPPSPSKPSTIGFGTSPDKGIQKKRSGFFSNSPFRRRSKHEQEPPNMATPTSRDTWGSPNGRTPGGNNQSPSRHGRDRYSGSPEPVDPRASFQLNVGNNVFDVASPDSARKQPSPRKMAPPTKELDPIAAALEELKGVNKQSSVRMSADRYAGVSTPAPQSVSSMSNGDSATAYRPTPPPSYSDQSVSRLGAPQPAFTSSQMRQTTQKYVGQNQEMYGNTRPGSRGNLPSMPRATSPRPMRSTSPRPDHNNRAVSPNPYGNGDRSRQTPNTSPTRSSYRHNSPNDVGQPTQGRQQYGRQERPSSSNGMAMQLADGSQRGSGRPQSYFNGQPPPQARDQRARSKSMANEQQYTSDGRPIIQFGKSSSCSL